MNQPRGPGRPPDRPYGGPAAGQSAVGSVRRARERMEANAYGQEIDVPQAAQPQQNPNFPLPSQPQGPTSGVPPSNAPPVANRSRPNPSSMRPIISNPTPAANPSWPLPEDTATRQRNNSPTRLAAPSKPPQRPPRPDYVPEILMQQSNQLNPSFHNYEQQSPPPRQQPQTNQTPYWQDNYSLTPNQDRRPANWASNLGNRPSTSSSFASIPDFPVPVPALPMHSPPQQTPRRMPANLGPPPSSRKGASSYYSQSSFVSPIPEDPEPRGTSYASSHVMPTSWGDGPPEYYMGDGIGDEDDDDRFDGDEGRDSRGGDHEEDSNLVRKASLGKRHKPALTTIKSDDGIQGRGLDAANVSRSKGAIPKPSETGRDVMAGPTVGAFAAGLSSPNPSEDMASPTDSLSGGTVLLDPSSSNVSSDRTGTGISNVSSVSNAKEQPSPALDPRVREIMGGLQRGGALQQGIPEPATSPLAGSSTRRPPPLNMEAVKNAEARGSLTSLPDLIRRATRVASNLDKGRTASRLGMRDLLGPSHSHAHNSSPLSRQGSLLDMLGSFPPPGVGTPTTDRPHSRWPSPFANSSAAMNRPDSMDAPPTYSSEKPKAPRRCCGLPVWGFVLLLLVLLLLAAAAVVIPIVLIVIPRSGNGNSNPTSQTSVAGCQTALPCSNGGSSILIGRGCGCICANNFTGSTCANPPTAECSTADFPTDTLQKVTLGTNVSSVISTSLSSFGIPLNATTILSSFAASNLSCAAENNLVTFNVPNSNSHSPSRRSLHPENINILRPFIPALNSPHKHRPRRPESSPQPTPPAAFINDATPTAAVVTSNGIIIAASMAAGADTQSPTIATGTGTVVATTPATPTATASAGGSANAPSSTDLGFSKAAILKVLEANGVTAAQQAQIQLQTMFLGGTFRGGQVDVGNGVTLDFASEAVTLADGKTVGGKAASR